MDIQIFRLRAEHGQALSHLLLSGQQQYSQYFVPFPSLVASVLCERLQGAERDSYWGIQWQEELAGFFHAARVR